jgi:hypothetical protein
VVSSDLNRVVTEITCGILLPYRTAGTPVLRLEVPVFKCRSGRRVISEVFLCFSQAIQVNFGIVIEH